MAREMPGLPRYTQPRLNVYQEWGQKQLSQRGGVHKEDDGVMSVPDYEVELAQTELVTRVAVELS